jgi:hypothetical protein
MVLSPLDQQIVARVSGSSGFQVANRDVTFQVAATPARSQGYAVGADDNATSATYTVKTDPYGFATATVILGDKEGQYQITASTPVSTTPTPATFTVNAAKPDSVVILKDTTDLADRADSYAVPSDQPTQLFAVGLDKAGKKLGTVKSVWSTAASGPGASRGSGVVNSSAATSSTFFTPSHVGQLTVTANPAISGVNTAKADLYITALHVNVDNTFSISNPVDQRDKFVPGEYLDGTDVPLSLMEQTGQFISLHVLTGPGAKGKVTFAVDQNAVSHFPGICMNYPINNPRNDADLAVLDNATNTAKPATDVQFAPDGDTWATLLVRDYAARGAINVTITAGKKTYTLKPVKLPIDNGRGLPTAGWYVNGKHIDVNSLAAGDDKDDQNSSSFTGQAGDGLSAFEEMRGVVEKGIYTRLDPTKRDLFLIMDQNIYVIPETPIARLFTLGPSLHFLDIGEVTGVDYGPRGLIKTQPVVNPNDIGSVPGTRSHGQRGVRVIDQQQFYPSIARTTYAGDPVNVPAYQAGIFGQTIVDGQDLSAPAEGFTAQSPDATQSVEIYEQTYVSAGIHTAFANGPFGYVDANGNPTQPCIAPGTPADCDNFDLVHHLILPLQLGQGLWDNLHTVRTDLSDYYSLPGTQCGPFFGQMFDGGFTPDMMKAQRGATLAHEVGHALHLDHLNSLDPNYCGWMMSDRISDTAPPPTTFHQPEINAVRLWQ